VNAYAVRAVNEYLAGNVIYGGIEIDLNDSGGILGKDQAITIMGNYLGTQSDGQWLAGVPNKGTVAGIKLSNVAFSDENQALGNKKATATVDIENNVISGNPGGGLVLSGASNTLTQRNYIGYAADGKTKLTNGAAAQISFDAFSNNNRVKSSKILNDEKGIVTGPAHQNQDVRWGSLVTSGKPGA
jgi:parallel beta-helix repeat protein